MPYTICLDVLSLFLIALFLFVAGGIVGFLLTGK